MLWQYRLCSLLRARWRARAVGVLRAARLSGPGHRRRTAKTGFSGRRRAALWIILEDFTVFFMSDEPFGRFENYIFTSPPFFI
jgi:hypothetical protein